MWGVWPGKEAGGEKKKPALDPFALPKPVSGLR